MHAIHECCYAGVKLPRNGNSQAKKLTEEQISLWKLSNTANVMEALDGFYPDLYHPFVD